MTDQERSLLDFLLSAEFPGAEALREQARHAQVDGITSGSPGFWLTVDRSLAAPASELARGHPIAVSAYSDLPGEGPVHLCLMQTDGWMDAVELLWYGEAPPATFPDLSLFDSPLSER